MNRGISAVGRPSLEGTTSIARLFMHARRHDMGLSISSCARFEEMAGLMDVPGTVYTSQEPYLDWHVEEIDDWRRWPAWKSCAGWPQR